MFLSRGVGVVSLFFWGGVFCFFAVVGSCFCLVLFFLCVLTLYTLDASLSFFLAFCMVWLFYLVCKYNLVLRLCYKFLRPLYFRVVSVVAVVGGVAW